MSRAIPVQSAGIAALLLVTVACVPPTSLVGLADPTPPPTGTVRVQGAVAAVSYLEDGEWPPLVGKAARVETAVSERSSIAWNGVLYGWKSFTTGVDVAAHTDGPTAVSGRIGVGWAHQSDCFEEGSRCDLLGLQTEVDVSRVVGAWTPYGFVGANPIIDLEDPFDGGVVFVTGGAGVVWQPSPDTPVRIGAATGVLVPGNERPLWGGAALFVAADLGRAIGGRGEDK